jgi:CheY-like chemotaxis protein
MPNVLVVDDSATQTMLIACLLEEKGVSVRTAVNGVEALSLLRGQSGSETPLPDLVVTDMQMPKMNGLELIRQMRSACPLVPAVLVTAFGNEDLAAEALGVGAANYISKEHVGVILPDTVDRLSRYAAANAESLDLKGSLTRTSFEFLLDCSIERVQPLVGLLLRLWTSMNLLHTIDRIRIAEVLHYLLFYSIVHGNLEEPVRVTPFSMEEASALIEAKRQDDSTRAMTERNVSLTMRVTDREARFVVSHEGAGRSIHHAPLPGTPQSFSDERGRGMLLLTSVMNEVFIDPVTYDVTMVKYIDSHHNPNA